MSDWMCSTPRGCPNPGNCADSGGCLYHSNDENRLWSNKVSQPRVVRVVPMRVRILTTNGPVAKGLLRSCSLFLNVPERVNIIDVPRPYQGLETPSFCELQFEAEGGIDLIDFFTERFHNAALLPVLVEVKDIQRFFYAKVSKLSVAGMLAPAPLSIAVTMLEYSSPE